MSELDNKIKTIQNAINDPRLQQENPRMVEIHKRTLEKLIQQKNTQPGAKQQAQAAPMPIKPTPSASRPKPVLPVTTHTGPTYQPKTALMKATINRIGTQFVIEWQQEGEPFIETLSPAAIRNGARNRLTDMALSRYWEQVLEEREHGTIESIEAIERRILVESITAQRAIIYIKALGQILERMPAFKDLNYDRHHPKREVAFNFLIDKINEHNEKLEEVDA